MSTTGARKQAPVRLALTGGIGSGKSTALSMFAARHAAVLNSDHIVHRLLQRRDVRQRISDSLEIGLVGSGEEGRRRLADVVFADDRQLSRLEAIMFPLVREAIGSWMETLDADATAVAVVELPMLFEAGMDSDYDYVIMITAPAELRQTRHAGRISKADFDLRAARQMPEEEKLARADFVYENTGSPEELDEFVAETIAAVTHPKTR